MEPQNEKNEKNEKPLSFEDLADQTPGSAQGAKDSSKAPASQSNSEAPAKPAKPSIAAPKKPGPKPVGTTQAAGASSDQSAADTGGVVQDKPSIRKPAPATTAAKPKPTAASATKPISKTDPSISFDDGPAPVSGAAIAIDAVAAVVSIAFTVLILQEALPFLK